jgi:coenzyme F420-0:L-glutamate ligase/coenzyme F420-1:gamma-L-glutamate ligase
MAHAISIIGLDTLDLIQAGDNLPKIIVDAAKSGGVDLLDNDVIVVSQKIISKSEGELVDISTIKPSAKARAIAKRTKKDPRLVQLILRDSAQILRASRGVLIVKRKDGIICLNAGVDKSNVRGSTIYTRLPTNADRSAQKLRIDIEALSGKKIAVIVADTYSRPIRVGQVEFAIGIAGMEPIVDYRGEEDLFGYELKFKYVALADEIAAAAELVMGQGTERIPVVIMRGLSRLHRTEQADLAKRLSLGRQRDLFNKLR